MKGAKNQGGATLFRKGGTGHSPKGRGYLTFGKRIEPKQTPLVDPSHPQPRITDTALNAFAALLRGHMTRARDTKGKATRQPRHSDKQPTHSYSMATNSACNKRKEG